MTTDSTAEWQIDPSAYPVGGTDTEKLRFLVRYAILAPSGHNTQPWLFRIARDHLDLIADRRRALPVVDPQDRALAISCGAAVGALCAAMRGFGHAGEVEWLPEPGDDDHLARVRLGPVREPTGTDLARFSALTERRTTRLKFADEALPPGLADDLGRIASTHGVEATVLLDAAVKVPVAKLVAEGDRTQFANPAFRRELGSWVHSQRARSRDGISGAAFGMPDLLSAAGALVIRTFDMGDGIAAKDEQIATGSPALVVVATSGDKPRDWLASGAAHLDMLLAVTAAGLTAAYLNQPVEVDELRPRLKQAVGSEGIPQLLFRIGRGPRIPPAIRRPVEEVIID